MKKLNNIANSIALIASLTAGAAFGASDGTLGATSSGTTDISLEIADSVRITSVEDIALGAWGGTGNLVGSTNFCVFRNGGDNYSLTLTADTAAFEVSSATTLESIPFSVRVDDDTDASDGQAVAYNTVTGTALTGSNSLTCGGADNASMEVTFAEANLQSVASGNDYQATVTILVEPI